MTEVHTVHCKGGGKVRIQGDDIEVELPGPVRLRRQHWIRSLRPSEEARRTMDYAASSVVEMMLAEAFQAVPMKIYKED